jgi:hypothetical protein
MKSKIHEIQLLKNSTMSKITLILLTLSTFLFLSCGKETKETTNDEPAIAVKVSGISADTNGEFVTASGKIEAENSANVSTRMMGKMQRTR